MLDIRKMVDSNWAKIEAYKSIDDKAAAKVKESMA
jgi:hypothetical protein